MMEVWPYVMERYAMVVEKDVGSVQGAGFLKLREIEGCVGEVTVDKVGSLEGGSGQITAGKIGT